MDYPAALHRLLSLADYERMAERLAPLTKVDLRRMEALVERLGHPERCAPVVHIAGTKGKGSTAAMVTSVLQAAGYRVGLFTSPHLHTFRERIRVGLEPSSEEEFAALVEGLWPHVQELASQGEGVTTFELLVAMAFRHFQEKRVDVQVLEVGLGGRLDATNVASGSVCLITSLSLDHTAVLGNKLGQIAGEKAGIIKQEAIVVSAPQPQEAARVIARVCEEKSAVLRVVGRDIQWERHASSLEGQSFSVHTPASFYPLWTPLLGSHQMENASVAVGALEALSERGVVIPPEAITEGFRNIRWAGRMEVLGNSPLVVADGAHNTYSMARLVQALREYLPFRRLLLVMGCSSDKDLQGMAGELASMAHRVFCAHSRHPRALGLDHVCEAFLSLGIPAESVGPVHEALRRAIDQAEAGDIVLITGSLFVVAEAIQALQGLTPEVYPEFEPYTVIPHQAV